MLACTWESAAASHHCRPGVNNIAGLRLVAFLLAEVAVCAALLWLPGWTAQLGAHRALGQAAKQAQAVALAPSATVPMPVRQAVQADFPVHCRPAPLFASSTGSRVESLDDSVPEPAALAAHRQGRLDVREQHLLTHLDESQHDLILSLRRLRI